LGDEVALLERRSTVRSSARKGVLCDGLLSSRPGFRCFVHADPFAQPFVVPLVDPFAHVSADPFAHPPPMTQPTLVRFRQADGISEA
jgi:hypothetical protein